MQELQPDLVITDIVMPNQEGLETIIAIHKADVAIPIIAISGGGGVDFLRAAEVFGASKILRKPFRTAALLAMVNECLTTNPA
jgi:DNA-binding NtrC family response regulator